MPESLNTGKSLSIDSELESLTPAEWEELYLRLRYFTYKYYAHLAKPGTILEDLIHDSIIDSCSADRVRPQGVSILNFICGVIRSNTSHYFEKESRRARLNSCRQSAKSSFSQSMSEFEKRIDLSSTMKRVEEQIKDDDELKIIHQSMIDDPETRLDEIAHSHNLSIHKVKNARKRYIRLVKKLSTA
jgi:hypothetical protein